MLNIDVNGATNPGSRRNNEDNFYFDSPPTSQLLRDKGRLFIVADGVGGHHAGEVASKMAVELIPQLYYSDPNKDIAGSLERAIEATNAQIHIEASQQHDAKGMATTLTAAVVKGMELVVVNVGDSRTYLVTNGQIELLTNDHTWVNQQVEAGILTPEQAHHHPRGNIVTRSLGHRPAVKVDVFPARPIGPGHTLLLCSDGLNAVVEDHEIAQIATSVSTVKEMTRKLIETTIKRGAPDNVTIIAVNFGQRAVATAPTPPPVIPTASTTAPSPTKYPQQKRSKTIPFAFISGVFIIIVLLGLVGLAGYFMFDKERPQETETIEAVVEVTPSVEATTPQTETALPISEESSTTIKEPSATKVEEDIEVEVTATPVPEQSFSAPPELIEPTAGQELAYRNDPLQLVWTGELQPDEQFSISTRNDTTGIRYPQEGRWITTKTEFDLPIPLPPGSYTWLITIEKNDASEQLVNRSAPQKFFILASSSEEPTASTPTTMPVQNLGQITLLEPQSNAIFGNATKRIEFRWQLNKTCNLPPNLGFEIRIWQENHPPTGVLDAMQQQGEITCHDGVLSYTVGDFQSNPASAPAGKFWWDVVVVQIRPTYDGTPLAEVSSPSSFELGDAGGGDKDGGDTSPKGPVTGD
ncbi:protein phosphatase 2C domain-containing protein [Anaerolineales bacterium HSG6]|nr:protein phosphatase 2C domain-containing protein [Anaerolineales bacterium HSG6]